VVWLSWFTDSINLWKRQDESPYLLDDPATAVTVGPSSSPTAESHQISSDPEPDTDDWDEMDDTGAGAGSDTNKPFAISQINWADINDEVEAAMNESDDDEGGDDEGDERSEVDGTEDGAPRGANNNNNVELKRKRSVTPSESGVSTRTGDDNLRSPLAKRRRQAAGRSGYSKLKEAITADDLENAADDEIPMRSQALTELAEGEEGDGDAEEESSQGEMDDDDDDDDDFLAREFEDELG
jgi:RNA polymerase II subunit A-like phosphatase